MFQHAFVDFAASVLRLKGMLVRFTGQPLLMPVSGMCHSIHALRVVRCEPVGCLLVQRVYVQFAVTCISM